MNLPNGQVATPFDIKYDVNKATDINKEIKTKVVLSFRDDELAKRVLVAPNASTISYTEVSGTSKLQDNNGNIVKSFSVLAN